ncbi:MAG TPA: cbb3-type cytochrome c oxidase subunit II [Chthoniobacterales bacterium]
MNRLPRLFLGIFATFAFAWLGLVIYPYLHLGRLQPYEKSDEAFPPPLSEAARAGQRVYAANGCVYCHSQQIRQPYATESDLARGWGSRPTVARDYLREKPTFLGTMRTGPDLSNAGKRLADPVWHYQHLFAPAEMVPGSVMPSFRYLFRVQKIGNAPSPDAVPVSGPHAPPADYEVIPTAEARTLVAYLLSLKHEYPLPEAAPPELTEGR